MVSFVRIFNMRRLNQLLSTWLQGKKVRINNLKQLSSADINEKEAKWALQ